MKEQPEPGSQAKAVSLARRPRRPNHLAHEVDYGPHTGLISGECCLGLWAWEVVVAGDPASLPHNNIVARQGSAVSSEKHTERQQTTQAEKL